MSWARVNQISKNSMIICGGDLNLDRNKSNDITKRPDLRVLMPVFNKCLARNDLAQINFLNAWHTLGRRSSLIDLFLTNKPQKITEVRNEVNILSDHEAVLIKVDCLKEMRRQQFITKRNHRNFTWENVEQIITSNDDL